MHLAETQVIINRIIISGICNIAFNNSNIRIRKNNYKKPQYRGFL